MLRHPLEWLHDLFVPTGQHGSADRDPSEAWIRDIQLDALIVAANLCDDVAAEQEGETDSPICAEKIREYARLYAIRKR